MKALAERTKTDITFDEQQWLLLHGGREAKHVYEDEEGKYVFMYTPWTTFKDEKVYLGS